MKFLVVDDDFEVVDLVVYALRQLNGESQIETASNGLDAWRKIQDFTPDLLVLDLKLPHTYGTTLCAKLKKSKMGKKTKVLILTSYLTEGVRQRVAAAGADACMAKPFVTTDFQEAVKSLIGNKGRE